MTAPAVPTPGDLARRRPSPALAPRPTPAPVDRAQAPRSATPYVPRALSVEESIAPGKLGKKEHFRKYYLFGLRNSGMPAHARLVGHDLMWRASHATGVFSPNLQPTTEQLALATGLTTGQADVALQVLHTRGWLRHRVLQDGPRRGQQVFVLTIPAAALEQIRARATNNHREMSR